MTKASKAGARDPTRDANTAPHQTKSASNRAAWADAASEATQTGTRNGLRGGCRDMRTGSIMNVAARTPIMPATHIAPPSFHLDALATKAIVCTSLTVRSRFS